MTPLEMIALAEAALSLFIKLKTQLDRPGIAMTDVEIAAYEALKASDHAKSWWQAD